MLSDQIALSAVSLMVSIAAALVPLPGSSRTTWSGGYAAKAVGCSICVAVGVFVTLFVVSGVGWGWPDQSAVPPSLLLASAGLAVGLFFGGFGWALSGRLSWWTLVLLGLNVGIAFMPSDFNALRLAAFGIGNFLSLRPWLARARHQRTIPKTIPK